MQALITARGITEVVHFTTNKGLLGVLALSALVPRSELGDEDLLEFILKMNSSSRRDHNWLGYVNMSISRINSQFFAASGYWHADVRWRVLSFSPQILLHEGVVFSTTNNIYPSVRRGEGEGGFEAMFADVVLGRYSSEIRRGASMPSSWTTCEQAEVLYPGRVPTEYLQKIYVAEDEDQDDVSAQLRALGHREIDIEVAPEIFRR